MEHGEFTELACDIHRLDEEDPEVRKFCSSEPNQAERALNRLLFHYLLMLNYEQQLRFRTDAAVLRYQAGMFGEAAKSLMEQHCQLRFSMGWGI